MEIYIAKNKTQMGPYDIGQVTQMLQTGILEKYDLYWHEGMLDWAPVASLIKNPAESHREQKNEPTVVTTPPYQIPYQVQNITPQGGSEPLATWSLVLGLLGLLCLGMIAGIPAIVCGHLALSNMNRNPVLQGRGSATAGLILGYLGTVIWMLFGISMLRR
jgi:hypothetical protein